MRKISYGSVIWGGVLIILGLGLLIENLNLLGDWNVPFWSLLLGAFGLFFLTVYVRDRAQWWALIPGLAILVIAVAVLLAELELVAGYLVGAVILGGVGLPFLTIFISDRQHWWALIPGLTMFGTAVAVFLEGLGVIEGETVGAIVVGGVSLGFIAIYLVDRRQWWALIPGGIMGIIAFFLLLATAAEFVWPTALILLGLLMLRGSLRGRRKESRLAAEAATRLPSTDGREPDLVLQATQSERRRTPSLDEQIRAAIGDQATQDEGMETEEENEEGPDDMPPPPVMPEPPQVPPGPEVA
jgi:hypothetical protein